MARLFNGEVVLVQGGMNIVGGVQPIRDAILAEVQEVAGPEAAQTLRAAGLVNLHKVLSAKQLNTLHGRVTPIMVERSRAITEALARAWRRSSSTRRRRSRRRPRRRARSPG